MRITINLPEELSDSLKRTALQERISVSRLVTGAVEYYLLEKRRRASGKKVLDLAGFIEEKARTVYTTDGHLEAHKKKELKI